MSKEQLKKLIKSRTLEIKKIKIGLLVRSTMPLILGYNLISDLEIIKLTKQDYSKITFDINYPVLKLVNNNKSIYENRLVSGYPR
jgi:hypothetical protein